MFNKFFPNLCVKVNKLWAKLTKNDEVIDVMEKGSVKVNPTLAGTEALITGLEVDGTKYKNVAVEANPTLAGTEADLSGLEVDGTKYVIPKGIEHLYRHTIRILPHAPNTAYPRHCVGGISFISKSSEPINTYQKFVDNVPNNSDIGTGYNCFGFRQASSTDPTELIYGFYKSSGNWSFNIAPTDANPTTLKTVMVYNSNTHDYIDNVVEIT